MKSKRPGTAHVCNNQASSQSVRAGQLRSNLCLRVEPAGPLPSGTPGPPGPGLARANPHVVSAAAAVLRAAVPVMAAVAVEGDVAAAGRAPVRPLQQAALSAHVEMVDIEGIQLTWVRG